jgi:hypothetical protein
MFWTKGDILSVAEEVKNGNRPAHSEDPRLLEEKQSLAAVSDSIKNLYALKIITFYSSQQP